ncbi:hypothetical protein CBL_13063 [Carabus blaptoides fortunei]
MAKQVETITDWSALWRVVARGGCATFAVNGLCRSCLWRKDERDTIYGNIMVPVFESRQNYNDVWVEIEHERNDAPKRGSNRGSEMQHAWRSRVKERRKTGVTHGATESASRDYKNRTSISCAPKMWNRDSNLDARGTGGQRGCRYGRIRTNRFFTDSQSTVTDNRSSANDIRDWDTPTYRLQSSVVKVWPLYRLVIGVLSIAMRKIGSILRGVSTNRGTLWVVTDRSRSEL